MYLESKNQKKILIKEKKKIEEIMADNFTEPYVQNLCYILKYKYLVHILNIKYKYKINVKV